MRRNNTVLDHGGVDDAVVFVQPGDRIAALRCRECRFISCLAVYRNNFRSPACKGVGVFGCCTFLRYGMRRNLSVFDHGGINETVVIIQPGDRVAAFRRRKGGFVCCITGYCYKCRCPANKGVSILRCSCFGCIRMCRNHTILDRGGVDDAVVIVRPGDGIAVL